MNKKIKDYHHLKTIVYDVLNEAIKTEGVNVDFRAKTRNQILRDDVFEIYSSSSFNTEIASILIEYEKSTMDDFLAYFSPNKKKITVFLDLIEKKSFSSPKSLYWDLISTSFHEYRHVLLDKIKDELIEGFNEGKENIITLDAFYLLVSDVVYHNIDHYSSYEELLADKYGIEKAKLFLKNKQKYNYVYDKVVPYMEHDEVINMIFLNNYNIDNLLVMIKDDIDNREEHGIVSCLFDNDKYKSLGDLLKMEEWKLFSKEVQYILVTSGSFLDSIDVDSLSDVELSFIKDAVKYRLDVEKNKIDFNNILNQRINNYGDIIDLYNSKSYNKCTYNKKLQFVLKNNLDVCDCCNDFYYDRVLSFCEELGKAKNKGKSLRKVK